MIRSMTGFGAAEGAVGGTRVSVELRTVNHRFFSPSIKLPSELSRWEPEVREALRRRIARGHVTVSARTERTTVAGTIDESRFAGYVALLRELRERHSLDGPIDVATVLRMPDVISSAGDEAAGTAAELTAVVDAAIDSLTKSRSEEGKRLAAYLLERLAIVEAALSRIAVRAPERVIAQRDRLRESVRTLTEGTAIDEVRVAQEIAILSDKLDVQEEIQRFASHITAFRSALDAKSGEPVGKRLGFLLQEMLREANTTGSKANDAAMLHDVVSIKEELERIREQVENLE
ncbi:MAG TPA: YicC/YloC family endoribonuclease [Gemmatimonadaceae bacterium]|jgi:uncharacterized protein (TIGR00255 family)|nr:YicC/YloC family endoribonuclease [Gemmatimonadaceae bacterium]